MRTAGTGSSAAGGPWGRATTRPWRSSPRPTSAPTRSYSAGRTYDLFSAYWGAMDRGRHPIADALNTRPKYLASTTITDPRWADTTVFSGDLAAAIGELKAKPAGELQVHGSGTLIRWLLDHDLVDEIQLLVVPVVLGQGARLFPEAGPDIALDRVASRADSRGVTTQVSRPGGRPQYATGRGCVLSESRSLSGPGGQRFESSGARFGPAAAA